MDHSFSLLSLFTIFLRQKKRIITHFLVVSAIAVTLSYLIPKNYKATVLFLPPYSESSGLSGLSIGPTLNIGRESAFTPQQIETLLGSRKVQQATVERFDLIHVYKTEKLPNKTEKAIKALQQNTKLKLETESGFAQRVVIHYSLSVVDKSGKRAAAIANFMIAELGRTMNELTHNQFRYSEGFMRARLDSVETAKKKVQAQISAFQKQHKVYSPELKDQVLASIDIYAELRKQKILAEMDRDLLLFDREKNSREVRFAQKKVDELGEKLKGIELGEKPDVMPGLDYSVDIAFEYVNLIQEGEVLTKLEILLRQQYEEARIRSARLSPEVRVVDPAVPPEWKNFPKKAYIVLIIVGLYMSCFLISILAGYGISRASTETRERLQEFRDALRFRRR